MPRARASIFGPEGSSRTQLPSGGSSAKTDQDLLAELGGRWPEIRVPGYWSTLGENCKQWALDVSAAHFWTQVRARLPEWVAENRRTTESSLLAGPLPDFLAKGVDRIRGKVLSKCRRDDAFCQTAFGTAGPPIPQLHDLVRTRISCKFLDGVSFLASHLSDLGKTLGVPVERQWLGSLEGYFAQHVTFQAEVYYRFGGGNTPTSITCEVQVGTDLSTRVWESAHEIYEGARDTPDEPAEWQWNPKDQRFLARELGHMIHLADGILVQLRDSVPSRKKDLPS